LGELVLSKTNRVAAWKQRGKKRREMKKGRIINTVSRKPVGTTGPTTSSNTGEGKSSNEKKAKQEGQR